MQPSSTDIQSLSYEKAFAELEEIVSRLESDSKTLDEAVALFERGQALAEHCANLLDQAELRVRQLSERNIPGNVEDQDID
jgi:exodeoxyribonuclease VII small subunit